MSIETRLRETGPRGGGGGGSSGSSSGLAGTGGLYVVYSTQTLLPFSKVLSAGNNVTLTTDGSAVIIAATTGGAGTGTVNPGSAGYVAYYPSAGTTVDDATLSVTTGAGIAPLNFTTLTSDVAGPVLGDFWSLNSAGMFLKHYINNTAFYVRLAHTDGASTSSAGLAGTGPFYLLQTSGNSTLPFSKLFAAGSSITTHTDSTNFYVNATTSTPIAYAPSGSYFIVGSAQPLLPGSRILTPGSSITMTTDATNFYITAITNTFAGSAGLVGTGRLINTTYPLSGGGDFSADRTHLVDTAFLVSSNRLINTTAPVGGGGNLGGDRTITVGSLSTIGSANQFTRTNTGGTAWDYINFRSGSNSTVSQGSGFIQIDVTTGAAAASGGLAGTGFFYAFHTSGTSLYPNSRVITSGSSTVVRTDGTNIYIDAITSGGAAGTNIGTGGFLQLAVQAAKLYANTSAARIDAGTPVWRLLFSPTTQQYGVWQFTLPFDYSGSPATQLIFSSDSSLSVAKSVSWLVDQWGFANSQGVIYVDSFAGTNTTTIALSAGYSAGNISIITVPLATQNSFAAGNLIKLRVSSSAGNVTGNQELVGLGLFYRAGTQTIATGSAGLMGTSTVVSLLTDITAGRTFNTTYSNSGNSVVDSVMVMLAARAIVTIAAGSAFFQAFADTAGVPTTPASGIVGIESGVLNEDNSFQLCFVATPGVNYRVNATTNNATLTVGKWFEFNL